MSPDVIREQIQVMPDGPRKELAEYINTVFESEYDDGWLAYPRYDLLSAPIWTPNANGGITSSSGESINETQHNKLAALREKAGGWFYRKGDKLIFATNEDWEKIRQGEQEP